MLSDEEQAALDAIEQGLAREDPDFAETFRTGEAVRPYGAVHWPSLLLVAAGLVLVLVGLLGQGAPVFVEGLVLAVSGFGFHVWYTRRRRMGPFRSIRRIPRSSERHPEDWWRWSQA